MNLTHLERCQEAIGYTFKDPKLLEQALTHASASATREASNERMEFLGDAVLGLVICDDLYTRHPHLQEGEMTKIKSAVVSRHACAKVANGCGIPDLLVLGKGVGAASALPASLSAAVLESVIGAIYLDGGLEPARAFILRGMRPELDAAAACQHQRNYKSLLQQYAQRHLDTTPLYDVLDEKGPEHAKCFEVAVRLKKQQYPSAWGNCKRVAEQKAAFTALRELGVLSEDEAMLAFDEAD